MSSLDDECEVTLHPNPKEGENDEDSTESDPDQSLCIHGEVAAAFFRWLNKADMINARYTFTSQLRFIAGMLGVTVLPNAQSKRAEDDELVYAIGSCIANTEDTNTLHIVLAALDDSTPKATTQNFIQIGRY